MRTHEKQKSPNGSSSPSSKVLSLVRPELTADSIFEGGGVFLVDDEEIDRTDRRVLEGCIRLLVLPYSLYFRF